MPALFHKEVMDLKKAFDKFVKIYTEILCAFGCIFYLTFCVCVLIQIISRNLLPSAPSWTEELARYTFVYMVSFGCGVAVLKDEFVFVEFLKDALLAKGHVKANKIIRLLVTIAMLVLSVYRLFFSENDLYSPRCKKNKLLNFSVVFFPIDRFSPRIIAFDRAGSLCGVPQSALYHTAQESGGTG